MRSAKQEWDRLTNRRRGLERRWEKYAAFTLPRLFTSDSWNEDSDELAHDWQAVGAQAVNHVVNKLMLAMFAPSRPFVRLEIDQKWLAQQGANIPPDVIEEALSQAELQAVKRLDSIAEARARLYLALQYLVVLGNVLMVLPSKQGTPPEVYGPRRYAVRLTGAGDIKCLVTRECLRFDELDQKVQESLQASTNRYQPDTKVELFKSIERQATGGYIMTQWVDSTQLPEEFSGAWKDSDALPYRTLVWNRKDGNNYGTGLVEDYASDFAGLSTLSESIIKAAILASEFRWLVNPAGMTNVDDFEMSENGSAIPGMKDDITLVANSKAQDLAAVQAVAQEYIQRIGRGFLLGSAVVRDSERTTATEVRMQAVELETSFGGTYSTVAVGLQLPLARWLLKNTDFNLQGTKIEVTIVTGLDALSRAGDLDALRQALADLVQLGQLSQALPDLNARAVTQAIFSGYGLSSRKYMLSPEEMQAKQQAAQDQQMQASAAQAGIEAGANAGAAQATQGTE